jgi:hypothetical protein
MHFVSNIGKYFKGVKEKESKEEVVVDDDQSAIGKDQ